MIAAQPTVRRRWLYGVVWQTRASLYNQMRSQARTPVIKQFTLGLIEFVLTGLSIRMLFHKVGDAQKK
jgi:hypothetical protein